MKRAARIAYIACQVGMLTSLALLSLGLCARVAQAAPDYSTPGAQRTGVWLVAKGKQVAVVGPSRLPPQGTGFDYYWLGGDEKQAVARVGDAMTKLGVPVDSANSPAAVLAAVRTGLKGGVGAGIQKGKTGIVGLIDTALRGGAFLSGPLPAVGGAGSAGAAAGGAEGAAGGAAGGGAVKAGENAIKNEVAASSPNGSAAEALSTPALSGIAAGLFAYDAHAINSPTNVSVTGGWFQHAYGMVTNYAWTLGLFAIAFFAFQYMLAGWLPGSSITLASLAQIPAAALWIIGVPAVVTLTLAFTDLLCQDVISTSPAGHTMLIDLSHIYGYGAAGTTATAIISKALFGHFVNVPGAFWLAMFGVIAAGGIAVELAARNLAIYLSVVFLAFAAVAAVAPAFVPWRNRLAHGLLVVMLSKFAIVLVLTVGALAVQSGITRLDPQVLAVGLFAVLAAAFASPMLYGALLHHQPWHSQAAPRKMPRPQRRVTTRTATTTTIRGGEYG